MTNFGKKLEGSDGGKVPGTVINVVSYNVLAQDLVDEHQYLYHEHNHKALLWEFRWSNLLYEIHYLDPDVILLILQPTFFNAEHFRSCVFKRCRVPI